MRDLLSNSKNTGVIIAGREHYFNSNEEMLSCLGTTHTNTIVGKCKQEFNDKELEEFLNHICDDVVVLPEWLPRRPLMCQAIALLDEQDLREILHDQNGDVDFWNAFIDILCRREARIREILDADTIKSILMRLARLTRTKQSDVGPISYREIQNAFEAVLGTHPVEEASVILQRLPGLGRTTRETDDRQFIDTYIIDGLRALDFVNTVQTFERNVTQEVWHNALDHLGQRVFVKELSGRGLVLEALNFVHNINDGKNRIVIADIACGLLWLDQDVTDFKSLIISDAEMKYCDLSHNHPKNLTIRECIIFHFVFPTRPVQSVKVIDCQVGRAYGVAGSQGVPSWVVGTEIERFQSIATVAAIRNVDLSPQHRILVTILKKTFFQPGSGRQEAALLRGLGQVDRQGYTEDILGILISEGLLIRTKGDHGNLYVPERKYGDRVAKMLSELNLTEDPLWRSVV